jgi:glycosyltransferase 2 family protein
MIRFVRRPVVWLPISLALLAFVIWRSRLWEAGDRLGAVDSRYLLLAVVLGQVIPVLWALRSADLLAGAGRPVPWLALLPMTSFANTINNVTPGSVGELARMWLLRAHHGVDYGTSGAVIVIERGVAIGYLAVSAVIVWLGFVARAPAPLVIGGLFLLAVLPGGVYRVGVRPSAILAAVPLGRLVGGERWLRWGGSLAQVDRTIASLLTRPARLATFASMSAAIYAVSTVQLVLVGRAAGVDLPLDAAWGALGIATIAGVLSFLPFGLGATDLVLVALLGVAGVELATAAAIAFGYRLVGTLPFAIEGVVSYAFLSASLPTTGLGGAMREVRSATAAESVEPTTASSQEPAEEPLR